MSTFIFSAAKQQGELVKGEREAENEHELAKSLKSEGLFLLEAKEKEARGGLAALNVRINAGEILTRFRPVGLVDKMFFARNLAVMVGAGLALTRALDALAQESTNQKLKRVIANIGSSVVKGKSFAESLRPHQKIFGELFINMVEVGETTGKLTLVLKLLANQMRKDHTLRKRVRGAMLYPAVILSVLVIVGALMMIYVVPTLSQTLHELGAELPITTQIIIGISDFMVNYILFVILAFAALVILFWRLLKTGIGKSGFDRAVLKVPIFGPLVKKFNEARFCRTLAYLIASGVPIVRSLEITSSVLGNIHFRSAIRRASSDIQKGKQLHAILDEYPDIFQPLVVQMIQVGEETGKVSEMLLRLAAFFEEDVTNTTRNMSSIIEPILMVVIGGAVGFFAVSMLQPIYSSLGNL